MTSQGKTRFGADVLVAGSLLAITIVDSLPPLLNAAGTQSDAAVVGLQAMHFLRGERAWFLWGSGYQTSVDSWVAAQYFRVFGPTPLALMLSAFVGYLVLIGFAYATIRRHQEPVCSALLVSPLAILAGPVHIYAFYPPRQASLTLLFLAVWLIDGADSGRRASFELASGALVAGLATFADPYCLLFLPGILVLIFLKGNEEGDRAHRIRLVGSGFAALAVGLAPFLALAESRAAKHGVYSFSPSVLGHNLRLLSAECLPYLLSTRVMAYSSTSGVVPWQPPGWFHLIQLVGAGSLLAGIAVGGLVALSRHAPPADRRLGMFGACLVATTLGAFLVSKMAMDRLSARYLVAIVLVAPFSLTPVARFVEKKRFAAMLAPYLASAAVGGWLGNGDNVEGLRIRRENGEAVDEHALESALRSRHLRYGFADYWVAYRLTFLFRENPILVPWHAELDRYEPYRRAIGREMNVAYVYDPTWSTEDLAYRKSVLREQGVFEPNFGEFRAGRYTVLELRRKSLSSRP